MDRPFGRFVVPILLAVALSAAACAKSDVNSPVGPSSSIFAPTPGGSASGLQQQPGDDDDQNEVEVEGIVADAPAGHECPAFTFTVGATTVTTSATTKFEDATCADVVNGTTVKVKGTRTSPSEISAAKVEKKK